MDTKFIPNEVEEKIYRFWEENDFFKEKKGKPFTILMPPPNANASLHAGHGMYTVDDIMIRYKILQGFKALWIPGTDHAGFETQYVYEKYLAKQDKSRMDFDRQTLYENIFEFVKNNSGLIYSQFKKLGFAADWSQSVFSLDKHVIDYVYETFFKMHKEDLVYRSDYIVNYCTHCGTSLSELEVSHVERVDPLYYIKYGPFVLATVRPETKFGDTALAVHPQDKRYKKWVGKEIEVEGLLGKFKLKIIVDDYVDPKFGTGVVKITPAHDPNDFLVGKRHNLEIKQVIDLNGRLTEIAGQYKGLKVKVAREKVVADLQAKSLIEKINKEYLHSVTVCYKCNRDLEPTIISNWFIKVASLKKPVIEVIKKNKVKFYPKKFKKQILDWLNVMHDWPISRQVVWGIRIPVWYSVSKNLKLHIVFLDKNKQVKIGNINELLKTYRFEEIEKGLQKLTAPKDAIYEVAVNKPGKDYLQETDTFDTWFSSSQWPLVTPKFPTDILGTLSDILPFWVSRMIMFSLYRKGEVPFKDVYLWSMVTDSKGQKMSKSKGNVINPIDLVNKYGADAFRGALFFGVAQGGRVPLSEEKVKAMRNFANKIWNMGRFIWMNRQSVIASGSISLTVNSAKQSQKIATPPDIYRGPRDDIKDLQNEFEEEKIKYHQHMEKYEFQRAFDLIYEFLWHRFADYFIERLKDEVVSGKIEVRQVMEKVYFENLKLLHPFMPFVTEAVWKVFHGENSTILNYKF